MNADDAQALAKLDERGILERVVARMPDGRTVTFEDGEVTGDDDLIAALEAQTGSCTLVIGLNYDASRFRESGNAFMAAANDLGQSIPCTEGNKPWTFFDECLGTEPVPPGDLMNVEIGADGIQRPNAEWKAADASYQRKMRAWRERRRRLRP